MYTPSEVHERVLENGQHHPAIVDNYGRQISYLRLAVTDRCNLRCRYCMPEEGIKPVSHQQTLSYEEMERLVRLFLGLGIIKIRLTGGEPFVRRGCVDFMEILKQKLNVPQLFVTTNGVETSRHLERLKQIGISGVNLSLDTLDPKRFLALTRRDRLADVLKTLEKCLELSIPLKINTVIVDDTSDHEIERLVSLVQQHAISLRFIEQMGFTGSRTQADKKENVLLSRLQRLFPGMQESVCENTSTAREFELEGFAGRIGVIEGHSRNFCSTCNKVRITPQGMLKACLYDNGILDLRALLRNGDTDNDLSYAIRRSLLHRHKDGHKTEEACANTCKPSMSKIGG